MAYSMEGLELGEAGEATAAVRMSIALLLRTLAIMTAGAMGPFLPPRATRPQVVEQMLSPITMIAPTVAQLQKATVRTLMKVFRAMAGKMQYLEEEQMQTALPLVPLQTAPLTTISSLS